MKMIIGRMSASWTTKATKSHSEYVLLFFFPLQQWLQEPVSLLGYKFDVCVTVSH